MGGNEFRRREVKLSLECPGEIIGLLEPDLEGGIFDQPARKKKVLRGDDSFSPEPFAQAASQFPLGLALKLPPRDTSKLRNRHQLKLRGAS